MKAINYNNSEIRFGDLASCGFNAVLNSDRFKRSKKVIITDENVYERWISDMVVTYDGLKDAEIIQLPAGEQYKTVGICVEVWNALSEYEIERNDLIINIGGGVITDMGGFIAATFKRGLAFVNVPTTLLAQVDASVGGKTGIDLGSYKNQIGAFADADFVFVDTNFLMALPKDELISGYAEMLKHGLISLKSYWSDLVKTDPTQAPDKLLQKIRTSVSIKREIVAKDHLETGLRKKLNFGHTIGHSIEGYGISKGEHIPHGFCVAWGMIAEAYISKQLKLLSASEFDEINSVLRKIYPPLKISIDALDELNMLLKNDKKTVHGELNFTLLQKIGEAVYNIKVSPALVDEAFAFILS